GCPDGFRPSHSPAVPARPAQPLAHSRESEDKARGRDAPLFLDVRSIRRVACVFVLLGCHSTPAAFGSKANADSLFQAVSERFTLVERSPRFAAARTKLIPHALAPSKVFDDTSVWNGAEVPVSDIASGDPPAVHSLVLRGAFENGHYRLFDDPLAKLPTHLGETQQVIRLERVAKGEFEWTTRAVGAVGSIT